MTLRNNFSAGPSALPPAVIERIRDDLPEWRQQGASIMEISHRGAAFGELVEEIDARMRRLLSLPAHYQILWMQGGASSQFSLVPMNLGFATGGATAAGGYLVTGAWSSKAFETAAYHQQPQLIASSAPDFHRVMPNKEWASLDGLAYCHVTANETIHGVQLHQDIDTGAVPLVVDSSSDFLSRPPIFQNFGLMYAGAQKNLGPAGVTVVIVREDLLERVPKQLAPMFNYQVMAQKKSLYNTPPVFSWYVCGLVLEWLEEQGGLAAINQRNVEKALLVYNEIGASGFYGNEVEIAARSLMNIPIRIHDPALEPVFLKEAEAAGFIGLKGHRSVGGLRVSLYNAVSLEQTRALVQFMQHFRDQHG